MPARSAFLVPALTVHLNYTARTQQKWHLWSLHRAERRYRLAQAVWYRHCDLQSEETRLECQGVSTDDEPNLKEDGTMNEKVVAQRSYAMVRSA